MRFLGWRFAIAAVALGYAFRRADRQTIRAGILLGSIWAGGYVAQTLGLRTSTATNVAFITGMYVVFTPLLIGAISRSSPGRIAIAGVTLATIGLVLLAAPAGLTLARGDALAICGAVLFAAHIVGIGIAAPEVDPIALTAVQSATAAVITLAISLGTEGTDWVTPSRGTMATLLLTGVGASAVALIVQTRAQRVLAATPVAVILTMESVFGGIFGFVIAGDRLDATGWAGAALIMAGVLFAATAPNRRAADLA